MKLPESIRRRIIALSPSHPLASGDTDAAYTQQKNALKECYARRTGLEKALIVGMMMLVILVIVEFFWIVSLQWEVSTLSQVNHIQETRLAQLEQSSKKQNNLLYSAGESLKDMEKKWHDLRFQVLHNTWKLNP